MCAFQFANAGPTIAFGMSLLAMGQKPNPYMKLALFLALSPILVS